MLCQKKVKQKPGGFKLQSEQLCWAECFCLGIGIEPVIVTVGVARR